MHMQRADCGIGHVSVGACSVVMLVQMSLIGLDCSGHVRVDSYEARSRGSVCEF